jgi:hypothetical protein
MSKISLTNLVDLQNETTAVNAINANNAALTTALDKTLSRDGTTPNTMSAPLDMNSQPIVNLPAPVGTTSPLRLSDLNSFVGGGTVTNIPSGGTTGQVLAKSSNTDYAVAWTSESAELTQGTNIVLTGTTPTTISTSSAPSFSGSVSATGADGNFNAGGNRAFIDQAGGASRIGSLVGGGAANGLQIVQGGVVASQISSNGQTFTHGANTASVTHNLTSSTGTTTVNLGTTGLTGASVTIAGSSSGATTLVPTAAASGTLILPAANDTLVGKATTDILTNKILSAGGIVNFSAVDSGGLAFNGSSSGQHILKGTATASGTLTLPAATDTLVGKATTDILTNKTFDSAGTGNSFSISGVATSRGQYPGETTTGSATAGNIGEYIESVIASGSSVALVTGTPKTMTSITLTAGDWDVDGVIQFLPVASTSITRLSSSISLSTNTTDATAGRFTQFSVPATVPNSVMSLVVTPVRMSVSGSTTVFLVADQTFSVSTLSCFGLLRARRVR